MVLTIELAIFIVIAFVIWYISLVERLGHKAAIRSLRRAIIPLAIAFTVIFVPSADGRYVICMSIFAINALWKFFWPNYKHRAGELLLYIERIVQPSMLMSAFLFFVAGLLMMLDQIEEVSEQSTPIYMNLEVIKVGVCVLVVWGFAISLIVRGLSRLELRENGMFFRRRFLRWKEIAYYHWTEPSSSVLVIHLLPLDSIFPQKISATIPDLYRDAVNSILSEKVPSLNEYRQGRRASLSS